MTLHSRVSHWPMIAGAVTALLTMGSVPQVFGQNAGTDLVPTVSFEPERLASDGSIVYGSATMLVRTRDRIFASVHTSGLEPGTAVSGWLAIFNDPRFCATFPCMPSDLANPAVQGSLLNFGGRVVGPDGAVDLAEVRAVGDTTRAQIAGPGLLDPRRAQIHVAVRGHGMASSDPTMLAEQLTTFNGGCSPTCVTLQVAVHQP